VISIILAKMLLNTRQAVVNGRSARRTAISAVVAWVAGEGQIGRWRGRERYSTLRSSMHFPVETVSRVSHDHSGPPKRGPFVCGR
jgi:hypothetical protein